MGVVTIGSFDGKGSFNVINDSVELEGDARYMSDEAAEIIRKEFHRIVKGIEVEFDVQCELTYTPDYPPVYNDPEATDKVASILENADDKAIQNVFEVPMFSVSEDFAYY